MKKAVYQIKVLSSLILSPRSGQALYPGIDEFAREPFIEEPGKPEKSEMQVQDRKPAKVVYPFYQYGEYQEYDPENASYYLPGSSVKGALLQRERTEDEATRLMADDILVPNAAIVLRNLQKVQYLDKPQKTKLAPFFDNVGVEMIKSGTILEGELYLEENTEFGNLLSAANAVTVKKMKQMISYIQMLETGLTRAGKNEKKGECAKGKSALERERTELEKLCRNNKIVLMGGYKGLLHSILQDPRANGEKGSLFIDIETNLPHGLVELKLFSESPV